MLLHSKKSCPHGDENAARTWIQDLLRSESAKISASEALEYANEWVGGIELLFVLTEGNFTSRFGPTGGELVRENLHRLEKPKYGFVHDLISDLPLDGRFTALRHWIVQVLVTCSHGDISVDDARALAMEVVGGVGLALRNPSVMVSRAFEDSYAKGLVEEALGLCISTMFDDKVMG